MSAHDLTGGLASPSPDSQKAACGSCAICKTHLNSSTEPKLLPCLHTVCHACLVKTRRDESTHECPLCGQSFRFFEVTDCIVFEDASNSKEDPKCSACEETEVSGWCVQCEEALCSDCVSAHHRVKVTRDHEVKHTIPPIVGMPRKRCPSHSQESLRFFCIVCEELTCKDCQLITHRGHSFVQQEEAQESQRQRLQSLLESIRKQKEAVSTSLQLLEARCNDIQTMKSQASKALAQLVHSIYQSLLLNARQTFKEVEALCAEEVKGLLQKKTLLNKMEDYQDYMAAFIDKILSTEGHCLLIHKKRIETQLRNLLSQKTCPPETMFELQLQIQKDHYNNIMKFGFMRVRRITVPFTSSINSNFEKSGEGLNLPSGRANSALLATNVHPLLSSSSSEQSTEGVSTQSKHPHSPSSNCVPDVPPPPKTHINHPPPGNPTVPEIQSTKPRKTWTFNYFPDPPLVSNQTPLQTQQVLTNTQATIFPKPVLTNHPTSRISHPIPANNQTPVFRSPIPANSTYTQTPKLAQTIPADNQTQAHPIPLDDRTAVFTQPVLANNQPAILAHTKPVDDRTAVPAQPILANNQPPLLTQPTPVDDRTTVLTQPIQAHPIPPYNQTAVLTQAILATSQPPIINLPTSVHDKMIVFTRPIQAHSQPPILSLPIPSINQTAELTHPIPVITSNNQTTLLASPVSSMPTDTRTLILAHPIQANILEIMHTFPAQPNIALTDPSNTLSNATVYKDHYTGLPRTENSQLHGRGALYPTSPSIADRFLSSTNPTSSPYNCNNLRTNLPVKALADSACDQVACVSSTDFTDTENQGNNLPTSTVSETEEPSPAPGRDCVNPAVPSSILKGLLAGTTVKRSPGSSQCLLRSPPEGGQSKTGHLSENNSFETGHWSIGMPTSFHQLVMNTGVPVCSDNVNDKALLDSVSCNGSESITLLVCETTTTHDRTLQSDFKKEEPKEEDEESAVTLEHQQQFKRFLRVNLLRLPVSLPPCGQTLPEFHLTTDSFADHTFVEKTHGIKQVWRWNNDPEPSKASSLSSQGSVSPLSSEVQFCSICQSAGATLLCSECGRAFHSDCHIPPIFVKHCEDWVCLLCLNVNDEIIMYGSEQKLSLSLQDQRKCEKLLLSLVCDENKYLLYNIKRSKMAEFDIILGRLLGKQKPPYRTPAELVSDVWTLLDILSTNSEKRDVVVKLQTSFQQQLNESFGKSLHASLLRCSSSTSNASDVVSQREKHKNTLKRMRDFFTTNCGTVLKKPCFDRGMESEDCWNPEANEHLID
ncbi:E3 ubiquitin-protein ligase TRIM33 isoform X2 [Triplophysa dalaica]|uniref:E3 ubiquitin-protein ligase TRIM33 isoform X2 n=1 Tax=Triplophysa dalaica TaxID=1582913 RepID=UPI0024DF5A04|nr:E3 ubiquitin-protein ligase TRIM33 isoform X2 [Triplophysa dalaica]